MKLERTFLSIIDPFVSTVGYRCQNKPADLFFLLKALYARTDNIMIIKHGLLEIKCSMQYLF